MSSYSYISNAHPNYVDALYEQFLQQPEAVEFGWRKFFEGFEYALKSQSNGHAGAMAPSAVLSDKEMQVLDLIHGYRNRAHLIAQTNPIKPRRDRKPRLALSDYGLSEADLDTRFAVGNELGLGVASLRDILARLQHIYCGHIGYEIAHIHDRDKRLWLRERIERQHPVRGYGLSIERKKRILEKLNGAVGFEHFLHKKYIGQKRFSLEGGENTIPALDAMITKGAELGVKEVVIGMAHRGRLNVLVNVMGKTYEHVFNEFEGSAPPDTIYGSGDVKYHLGYSSQIPLPDGSVMHLKLAPNPSHLEAVDPVVEGFARAKADLVYQSDHDKVLPVLIHGDAAVAGQGIVYETVQMSELPGYSTGGTMHFVINNQIGFTTDYDDARSSVYCTGAAAVVQAPVFHVNGDDPEAVVYAVELALEYRQEFNSDVFIDMVCYRRHGHNEGDDPQFTQPRMYQFIEKHPNPREIYVRALSESGELEAQLAQKMEEEFYNFLQERLDRVKQKPLPYQYQEPEQAWRDLKKVAAEYDDSVPAATAVQPTVLRQVLEHLVVVPEGFTPLNKVSRLLKATQKSIDNNQLDWALGELLAYGSILLEGKDVRMSGQDVKRGTFSHRHAVLFDTENNKEYNRLNHIASGQGQFRIFNSLLSEYAVLGFEYGYSMATPHTLVVWEAQFGDFSNGAATIIDQFIAAGESKWQRQSGIVLLLPHGYEGQGPEHSSARLERFLQLCAENNMTVANITTPANFFHLLRRQLVRPYRKPLVVMSPKSLLRHPRVVSPLEDFAGGHFQEIIDDARFATPAKAANVKRLVLCSGKVYYDLLEQQLKDDRTDLALCRLEQIYPLKTSVLDALLEKYHSAQLYWVQEEPMNMGAWQHLLATYPQYPWHVIARPAAASPATGFKKVHDREQAKLVAEVFTLQRF